MPSLKTLREELTQSQVCAGLVWCGGHWGWGQAGPSQDDVKRH